MANIIINEVSQNYTYNIGANSFAAVALPITSCWGPGYVFPYDKTNNQDDLLENVTWQKFPATQAGLESFVSTFRGPVSHYRAVDDYSYQAAMTLLTAGYDVLVCRLAGGSKAQCFIDAAGDTAYELLTAQPDDWASNYANYYISAAGGYVHVQGVPVTTDVYTAFTEENEPADWATTYNTLYYIEDAQAASGYSLNQESDWATAKAQGLYTKSEETHTEAPQFAENTYYRYNEDTGVKVGISAKYPGTFGNNLKVVLQDRGGAIVDGVRKNPLWNLIVYVVDPSGTQIAVENLTFVFDIANATETILHVSEVESAFVNISANGMTDNMTLDVPAPQKAAMSLLAGGTDFASDPGENIADVKDQLIQFACKRFNIEAAAIADSQYVKTLNEYIAGVTDISILQMLRDREWVYMNMLDLYTLLEDRMSYSPNRVICTWDDQNIKQFDDQFVDNMTALSPSHIKLLEVGYYARCATPLIDIPRSLLRKYVSRPEITSIEASQTGYAQKLGRYQPANIAHDIDLQLYHSHSAAFAPWGQYTYVGTNKPHTACPSFLALLIQRAMILNQSAQYEWALPSNRRQNVNIGKLDYTVPKKYLDIWQPSPAEGVCVNAITYIPEIGTTIWGNSTLFEIPPATYQALENLSTRYLYNAVKDIVFRCGTAITYTYNNDQAYSAFYAGVTPTLDTMKNVGAITGYRVEMSADIRGEDQVNANTIIGKIYLAINDVVNDIVVDLIALPPNVDVTQFAG